MNKVIYIILLALTFCSAKAQMQTARWYFGHQAGVDFTSGSPVAVTDGVLSTSEGSACMSDENGNLLFYTDGKKVYTASHQVMPNGDGLNGNGSSSQSAIIVPAPGITGMFYIFTTDAVEFTPKYGFRYTLVNMSLGAEGEVVQGQKNIPVALGGQQQVSEKVTAVAKADCSGYWIITYYSNTFYAFSLTASGLETENPIISDAMLGNPTDDTQGYIKVSPNGSKLAAAFKNATGKLMLYDFNTADGTISNGNVLSQSQPLDNRLFYSVEFSPNSQVLYATYSGLVRYDLTAPSIPDSEINFYNTSSGVSGTLQLGLDGKIYYSRMNTDFYLGVINDPDNFNAPALDPFGLFLAGKVHNYGLPNFPQPFYHANIFVNGSQEEQQICQGVPANFSYCFNGGVLPNWTVLWNFGDGTTSTENNPDHSYSQAGSYTITLQITIGLNIITVYDTIIVIPGPVANEPSDLSACDQHPNDGFANFALSEQTSTILGSQSSELYSVTYHASEEQALAGQDSIQGVYTNTANPQTMYARVTRTNGCYDITSFDLIVNPTPAITDPEPLSACETLQGQGIATFNLTQAIPQITSGNTNIVVNFYKTMDNLTNNIPITNLSSYANITPYSETIYFKAINPSAPACSSIGTLDLSINPIPAFNSSIAPYRLCDTTTTGDGIEVFDLTSMYSAITGQPGVTLTYAYDNNGILITIIDPVAFANTVFGQQTIYVTGGNNFICSNTTSFTLIVDPLPQVNEPAPFFACEEIPGQGLFNLNTINGQLGGATVSYYLTEVLAEAGEPVNSLPSPYFTGSKTIYARVETAAGCMAIVPVTLEVLPAPIAQDPDPLEVCDDNNDGHAVFNLNPIVEQISDSIGNVVVTIHETVEDANGAANAIPDTGTYQNIEPDTQTLWIRVGSQSGQVSCYDVVELQLMVRPIPEATVPEVFAVCDDNTDDIGTFDLTTIDSQVLNTMDPAQFTVEYYTSFDEAQDGINPIANPVTYASTSASLFVRVENNATGCFDIVDLDLIVNPLPNAAQPTPYTLCDLDNPGDEQEVFDLTTKILEIIGTQEGINVTIHQTMADAMGDVNAESNPTAYINNETVETLFVRVEVAATDCFRVVLLDVRVEPLPILDTPTQEEVTVCDPDTNGIHQFDLEALALALLNDGQNMTLAFYETEQNAFDQLFPIPNSEQYTNENPFMQFVYVVATNTMTGCSSNPITIEITITPSPVDPNLLDSLEDLVLCDDDDDDQDGIIAFDLTQQNQVIVDAIDTPLEDLTIHYFTSDANSQADAPRITNDTTFPGTDGQQIFVRIEDNTTGCYNILSFLLQVGTPLDLVTPPMFTVCNSALPNINPQTELFDLTTQNNMILGPAGVGQGYTVEYYLTQAASLDSGNAIANPTTFTNTVNPQTLYVAVTNTEGCRSYMTLTLKVLPLPTPDIDPDALVMCDDTGVVGEEVFDLTDAEADIRDNDSSTTVTYYPTMADAEAGTNPIADPTAHTSASGTVYVRVEANTNNPLDPNCYQVVELELIVNPLPALGDAGDITPYAICEQNTDGLATFDFNTHNDEVLNGADTTGYTFTYFASAAAAQAGFPALPQEGWVNDTMTQQEIWVTVVNGTTDCIITDSFMIYVEEQAIANPVDDVTVCDQMDGTNDGIANLDLTQFDAQVLGTQPQGQPGDGLFVVEYYIEDPQVYPDATPIADPVNFRNETSPVNQIIYIRVYDDGTISKCSDYTSVLIHVEELPEPTLKGGTICVDYNTAEVIRTHLIDTQLDATHTIVWTFNGIPIAGATGPTYEATQAGTYNVTATSANGCFSDPIADAIVLQSGPAAPIGAGYTVSNYFSDEQVITVNVEGYGTYEYSLDGGAWVESNIFTNVSTGDHTIQVRDITACSEFILTLEEVSTVDYPRYFTPNGDGYHDTWNIVGLGDDNTDAKIYIFDRYGKLVKQISSQGEGWDGTMNGTMMPATDYWFKVMYRETVNGVETIKEFRAHFSLKR